MEQDPDIPTKTDEPEDSTDFHDEHMWLDDNVKKVDPWRNVQVEPIFKYPVLEDQFLFNDINQ